MAAIVEEVTDDKSLPKAVRKEEQIKTSSTKSPRAKLLKLADKTSNLRSLAISPPAEWNAERALEYVDWADAILEEPLRIDDGYAQVPDRPGIGLTPVTSPM